MDSTNVPAEVLAYMDALYAANPDEVEARELTKKLVPVIWAALVEVTESAVLAERKACAEIAARLPRERDFTVGANESWATGTGDRIADAIRARG
jgi:hypothetical protein